MASLRRASREAACQGARPARPLARSTARGKGNTDEHARAQLGGRRWRIGMFCKWAWLARAASAAQRTRLGKVGGDSSSPVPFRDLCGERFDVGPQPLRCATRPLYGRREVRIVVGPCGAVEDRAAFANGQADLRREQENLFNARH